MSEKRRQQLKAKFLKCLAEYPIITIACQRCSINRATLYNWRGDDSAFDKQVEVALIRGTGVINDLAESRLIVGIKNDSLPAIRYWLAHNYKKYRSKPKDVEVEVRNPIREMISRFGLDKADGISLDSSAQDPDQSDTDEFPPSPEYPDNSI